MLERSPGIFMPVIRKGDSSLCPRSGSQTFAYNTTKVNNSMVSSPYMEKLIIPTLSVFLDTSTLTARAMCGTDLTD